MQDDVYHVEITLHSSVYEISLQLQWTNLSSVSNPPSTLLYELVRWGLNAGMLRPSML